MKVHSHHTFIFPFIWENTENKKQTYKDIVKLFKDNSNWVCTDMPSAERFYGDGIPKCEKTTILQRHKEFQYFHSFVRPAIYGFNEGIVSNFSLQPDNQPLNAHYLIKKKNDEYDLTLCSIRLKIFNTGIALLLLEGEYLGHKRNKCNINESFLTAVKNINDYGRRISIPFIAKNGRICADSLTVTIKASKEKTFGDNFENFSEKDCNNLFKKDVSLKEEDLPPTFFGGQFITEILNYGNTETVFYFYNIPKDKSLYTSWKIAPAFDDRMFVSCYLHDPKTANDFLKLYSPETKDTIQPSLSKSLYELVFSNHSDGCSCQFPPMLKEHLDRHTYLRWLDYGSLYSYTAQGMMMVTSSELEYLKETFCTIYLEICCLCLAQKASLINFQQQASRISHNFGKKIGKVRAANTDQLIELQNRFTEYQSQLAFSQITTEEQGIDVYDFFIDFMQISQETDSLQKHLDCLRDQADTVFNFSINRIMFHFTWISVIISLVALYVAVADNGVTMAESSNTPFFEKLFVAFNHSVLPVIPFIVFVVGILAWIGIVTKNRK